MSVAAKNPRIYTKSVAAGKDASWFDIQEKLYGTGTNAAKENRMANSTYAYHRQRAYEAAGRSLRTYNRAPKGNVTVTQEMRLVDGVPTVFTTHTVTVVKSNTTTQTLPTIKDVILFAEKNPSVVKAFVGQ